MTRTVQAPGHLMRWQWLGGSGCLLWILPDPANSVSRTPSRLSGPGFRVFLPTVLQPSETPACSYFTISSTSCHVKSAENAKPSARLLCAGEVYVGRLDAAAHLKKKGPLNINFRQSFSSLAKQARDLNDIMVRGRGRDGTTTELSGGFDQFW